MCASSAVYPAIISPRCSSYSSSLIRLHASVLTCSSIIESWGSTAGVSAMPGMMASVSGVGSGAPPPSSSSCRTCEAQQLAELFSLFRLPFWSLHRPTLSTALPIPQAQTHGYISTQKSELEAPRDPIPFTAGWQSRDVNPLVLEKAEGIYVYDVNGKKYLDFVAVLWCTALGGSEPRLVATATRQLSIFPFQHCVFNQTTKLSLDLAKELVELFTASKMSKVFFTNSGSEANDSHVQVFNHKSVLGI